MVRVAAVACALLPAALGSGLRASDLLKAARKVSESSKVCCRYFVYWRDRVPMSVVPSCQIGEISPGMLVDGFLSLYL